MAAGSEPPRLSTTTEPLPDGRLRLVVRGELDIAGVQPFKDAVGPRLDAGEAVLLDLGGLDFMDSSGVRVLHELAQRALAGVPITISTAMKPPVRQVLELTGVISLLPLEDDAR